MDSAVDFLFVPVGVAWVAAPILAVIGLVVRAGAKGWSRLEAATAGAVDWPLSAVARGDAMGRLVRVQGRVAPSGDGELRAPMTGRSCCWYAAWVLESPRYGSDSAGPTTALFERSTAPVLVAERAGDPSAIGLDPASTWVEPSDGAEDRLPFGASLDDDGLMRWPMTHTYAEYQARRSNADKRQETEIILAPGEEVQVYGVPTSGPDGKVWLLPPSRESAAVLVLAGYRSVETALAEAEARRARGRRMLRLAAVLGVGAFVVVIVTFILRAASAG